MPPETGLIQDLQGGVAGTSGQELHGTAETCGGGLATSSAAQRACAAHVRRKRADEGHAGAGSRAGTAPPAVPVNSRPWEEGAWEGMGQCKSQQEARPIGESCEQGPDLSTPLRAHSPGPSAHPHPLSPAL